MGRLIYSSITSLDGYVADTGGRFNWSMPDEAVHTFVNELMRPVRVHLYGRRLYEVMVAWETMDEPEPVMRDFADMWRAADKIVYSTTLDDVSSERSTIERHFDLDAVRDIVATSEHDVLIGGPNLAGQALAAGIIDDIHVFMSPVIVGGGTRWLPDDVQLDLELVDEHRFDNGVVHLHHRVVGRG